MRFHFRASIRPIFENHVLRAVSGPFHPLYETKISNRSPSVVYGSITLKFFWGALGTSSHQWFKERNEIQKMCFFGTLYWRWKFVNQYSHIDLMNNIHPCQTVKLFCEMQDSALQKMPLASGVRGIDYLNNLTAFQDLVSKSQVKKWPIFAANISLTLIVLHLLQYLHF